MGRIIPYILENKKWSKPPTNISYKYVLSMYHIHNWLVVSTYLSEKYESQLGG